MKVADYILDFIKDELSQQRIEEREKLLELLDTRMVDVVHTNDCEYQRLGCDCGYLVRLTNNETIKDIKKLITKEI